MFQTINWFIKSRRASSIDDYETWIAGGVATTLNVMDNTGDSRATVLIIFSHTQSLDAQPSETVSPTLRKGGAGMAILKTTAIQGNMIGRADTAGPQGKGYTDEYNDSVSDTHHTLRSGTKQSTGVVDDMAVRRLTPLECERLQGFPDGWTEGQADTHRYKQMGNAVAVPVVSWLIKRLMEA